VSGVLVVRLSAMGDVVQSLGAVLALRAVRPELPVHWVVQRGLAPLLDGLGFASIVRHDRDGGISAFRQTVRALRALRVGIALDLQGNWKSASLARLSGAAEVVGGVGPGRQEPWSAVLLRRRVPIVARHPARIATALVRHVAPDAPAMRPRLVATPGEIERERGAIRALGVDPDRPFRTVVLVAASDCRALRVEAIAREAQLSPIPFLCVAGPEEATEPAPAGLPVLRHAPGEVRRLIALAEVVRGAGGTVLGPDTGATHVLSAAGAPTLAAFGPTDPARTAPLGATLLRRCDPPPCMPCRRRTCRHPHGPVCMDVTTDRARTESASPA
jgi:ADP-heptose:LPS heptosyltransferase